MLFQLVSNRSIKATLDYHEQKVDAKKAECILAQNFLKKAADMSIEEKLARFERIISLNERTEKNVAHIFLSFARSEEISDQKMRELAKEFMEKTKLARQPYLVYRHHDTGIPHMHIVSTKIKPNGERIDIGPEEIRQYHKMVREMNALHSLATLRKREEIQSPRGNAKRVVYGESEIKPSISKALDAVIDNYRYTSLEELNAVLRLYNVKASRGESNSEAFKHRGLYYYLLNEKGKQATKPFKASSFDLKPTLSYLEKKFALNEGLRQGDMQRVKTAIDWTLINKSYDLAGFQRALEKERVSAVFDRDKAGRLLAVFYVDHQNKVAIDGRTLGEKYSIEGIGERCRSEQDAVQEEVLAIQQHQHLNIS